MEQKIKNILAKIKSKHVDDPTISLDSDEITNLLLQDVDNTIKILNELDEESLEWISSDFEELSFKFQNIKFVECVKKILTKFPNNKYFKEDVPKAIEAYYPENK